MKFLLLMVAVGVLVWMLTARSRGGKGTPPAPPAAGPRPVNMVSCMHCGVHLPVSEALQDSAGRHFCSEAHRLAGPH